MRPSFEKDLRALNTVAKEEIELEKRPESEKLSEEVERLAHVLDWHLEQVSERQKTSPRKTKEIYKIQKQKRVVFERLKNQLACLDNPDCEMPLEAGVPTACFDKEKSKFIYKDWAGAEQEATAGEIITGLEWDIVFNLDRATTPRNIFKRYLLEKTKKDLIRLLNFQLRAPGVGIHSDDWRGWEKNPWHIGFVAEKMVKSILNKARYDVGAPFVVEGADAYQDSVEKIDFIIKRREKTRGVNVGTTNKSFGIQFTMKQGAKKREAFEAALRNLSSEREVSDILFVRVYIPTLRRAAGDWKERGYGVGGPDKYLDSNNVRKIFFKTLERILSPNELEDLWAKLSGHFSNNQPEQESSKPVRARELLEQKPLRPIMPRGLAEQEGLRVTGKRRLPDWLETLIEYEDKIPKNIFEIVQKLKAGPISNSENQLLDNYLPRFWRKNFGTSFYNRQPKPKQ